MASTVKGLCIKGLDMVQISQKMAAHVAAHVEGFTLAAGASLFQESYALHRDEVTVIPDTHKEKFLGVEWFNGASGVIEAAGREYIIMLLSSEDYSTAYLLSIQGAEDGENLLIIGDFLCS